LFVVISEPDEIESVGDNIDKETVISISSGKSRMKSDADLLSQHVKFDPDQFSLKPLKAQVGGHVYMKSLNDEYVCKPLNERELQFYQNIPPSLVDHVPTFQGTLVVGTEEHGGNRREAQSTSQTRKYLVLENLTKDFNKPCILDLKMGTRMYGDFASDSKRKSQRKKSKKSTSAKLGVRFCGSQRFSVANDSFEILDKYVGRNADESELRRLLEKFFTHKRLLRKDVINNVLGEICRIKKSLLDLEEYRFYSSSLLIIYEGLLQEDKHESQFLCELENSLDCENFELEVLGRDRRHSSKYRKDEAQGCSVKMKIIDFANISVPTGGSDQSLHEGPDRGFLLGLNNLYVMLESLMEEEDFK